MKGCKERQPQRHIETVIKTHKERQIYRDIKRDRYKEI